MNVDYRALLAKYIQHVYECEGADYLQVYNRNDSDAQFTDEEWAVLRSLVVSEP